MIADPAISPALQRAPLGKAPKVAAKGAQAARETAEVSLRDVVAAMRAADLLSCCKSRVAADILPIMPLLAGVRTLVRRSRARSHHPRVLLWLRRRHRRRIVLSRSPTREELQQVMNPAFAVRVLVTDTCGRTRPKRPFTVPRCRQSRIG